jgi:hypothetical protein
MGYRAPSAEDIYRYAFRLDSHSRSLTDGFGLSIIFVNDNSSVCQDLISQYFVDLCHRTADRIRVIFFSELPESYFEGIADLMNSGSDSSERLRREGILGQVIELPPHKPFDDPQTELFDYFFTALCLRDYNEVDWLLSRISYVFGPRYADALYRLAHEHRDGDAQSVEIRASRLILELQSREWRSRNDRFQRMYDDHWRDLTPSSIIPIDAPERTRELSFNTKNKSVMPGVGEAMRFASRLGIGRYVPCFVFFTDVGQLSVDVFPVGNLSAHEAYRQLRAWIDGFYEDNRVSTDKWSKVEKDIIAFTSSINKSLAELLNWIGQSEELWDELRFVAQVIVSLSTSFSKPEAYNSTIDQLQLKANTSSKRCRKILYECGIYLKGLYGQKDRLRDHQKLLETVIKNLSAASNFAEIYDELSHASKQPLTPTALNFLFQPIQLMSQQKDRLKILHLREKELFTWWGLVSRKFPSFRKFKKLRKTWALAANLVDNSTEAADEIVQFEYMNFLAAISELNFSDTPELMMEKTLHILADVIGVNSHVSEWRTVFSEYSVSLMYFFHQLHDDTPVWITRNEANLKIVDVIPSFQNGNKIDFEEFFNMTKDDYPLRHMIQNFADRQAEVESEIEKIAFKCRDEVLTAFGELQESPLDISSEERAAYLNCLLKIRELRDKIEQELLNLANYSHDPNKLLHLVETRDIEGYLRLLDEYDHAVNSFVYPYKRDRKVQEIGLSASFSQFFELEVDPSIKRRKELQEQLEKSVLQSQSGVTLLQNIQQRSCTMTPVARLATLMNGTELPKENTECLDLVRAEDLEEKLRGLNDRELKVLSDSLVKLDSEAELREEIIEVILAIIGLIPARELAIHRQYANRPINIEVKTVTEQSKSVEVEMNFHAPVMGATGKNEGIINIITSEQKQTFAEAAAEIQQLLKQLEKTNPSATEYDQVAYVHVKVQPNLKQRTVAALKAGGETSIDEFFLENKYLKVGKAVVKAWLKPGI